MKVQIQKGKNRNIELAQNDTIYLPINKTKKFWADVDNFFQRGVRAGVDFTYNAATDAGIPHGTGGF